MLKRLRIQNILLIDNADLEFGPGMTVISGETGAGKSILLAALGLVLGDRASSDLLGQWGDEAVVEATFELPDASPAYREVIKCLKDAGVDSGEGLVVIRRVLNRSGRSRAFINNGAALQKLLAKVASHLVDLHGQHEHQSLFRPETYAGLLDQRVSGTVGKEYEAADETWRELMTRLEAHETSDRENRRKEDLLRYQIQEIEEVNLEPGEDVEIDRRLKLAKSAEQIRSALLEVDRRMAGGGETGLMDGLSALERRLADAAKIDGGLVPIQEAWASALIQLEELCRDVQAYGEAFEEDSLRLDELQERSFLIAGLKRKYGESVEEILSFRDRQTEELETLTRDEREIETLRAEQPVAEKRLVKAARALHNARAKAAKKIATDVESHLHLLGMKRARFEVGVDWREDPEGVAIAGNLRIRPGARGADRITFRLSTIPDRPLADLRDVASGGEISRIMLALKSVLGRADGVPTMVFDEIDNGIGGRMSEVVADRLAALAEGEQILCITHLAQIAARAASNFAVNKIDRDGGLVTVIEPLTGPKREKEILRMLGGKEDSESSKGYVREILNRVTE